MKNTCDICGNDKAVLVQCFIYDKNFGNKSVVTMKRLCLTDIDVLVR